MGRAARAARFRRGSRRPRATSTARCARASGRTVLDRLHPRHQAGVPDLDVRPTHRIHAANVAGTDRWRDVLRAAAEGDHRTATTRCDRRGQRQLLPRVDHREGSLRAHRQLSAAGDEGRRHSSGIQRTARRRSKRVGRVPGRVRPHPSADMGGLQRVGAVVRCPSAGRPRVHSRERAPQPVHVSRSHRLHGSKAVGADMASPGLFGPGHRCAVRGACRARRRRLGWTVRWSTCRSVRSGPQMSS